MEFVLLLVLLGLASALRPIGMPKHCNQDEAVRQSIDLVHQWSTYLNNGDPDFMIKNFLAEDALLYYVPDEDQCSYQPISLAVSLIQAFSGTIKMELIIKNVKWYEWEPCGDDSSSSESSSDYWKPRADAKDGDVVVSAVGFISADGMNPSLYNVLFYLRPICGCHYKVYRQVITPYACLAKIAGNLCPDNNFQ